MAKMSKNSIAKKLILSGEIKTLPELLSVVDETPFSRDIGTTPERFSRLLDNPTLFRFADVYNMASTLGVDSKIILEMIHEYNLQKQKRRR
ncbi:hypothetical protein GCM10011511_39800 [Puia dinghuensis]|uniref:Uncharacterized protein n=1 Tax=Puia dinghuensis TaxID=1792502 RepID=A0A8J2XUF8_9BACT|nr:hypothetical protein GCM10011511_39800 [Puia dinghuensis]